MQSQIASTLQRLRIPLSNEKAAQDAIERAFKDAGLPCEREVRLSPGDIVDFMVGTIAVEVKIYGQRREIFRQLTRYAQHERVKELLLVTNLAMGLPPEINGKPARRIDLGRAWL